MQKKKKKKKKKVLHAKIKLYYINVCKNKVTAEKEVRRQLHKNVASNIEQVLEVTPHKAPTIRPPASHHENYPS